ncbi:hypothetical protein KEM48_009195 [Puccinia striiformis f. sp. tritici PST-130]|nr:hypothetical protein KEM48_009195 [Puccinia striiformis f. sp. tritici PST-130]
MAWHAFLILSSLCIPCQSMDDFDFGFGFDWHDEPPTLDDVLAPFGSAPVPVPHPSGVADQLSIPLHQACRSLQPESIQTAAMNTPSTHTGLGLLIKNLEWTRVLRMRWRR